MHADLPVNNDILGKMMSEGDLAGTGSIDFTAFITMMSKKMKKVRPKTRLGGNRESIIDLLLRAPFTA